MTSACLSSFRTTGIEVIDPFLDDRTVDALIELVEPLLRASDRRRPGVRRILQKERRIAEVLRESPVFDMIESVGGTNCRIIRAVLLDKTAESNWMVPWHQDATIAVDQRLDVPGFGPWAIKDGEHHCQPPLDVLESIFTIRLHLDPCGPDSGPLRVVAGSHLAGLLDEHTLAQAAREGAIVEAVTGRGGAVLTMPLAVHSSPKAIALGRRRVLHLDCSSAQLPGGLYFAESQ